MVSELHLMFIFSEHALGCTGLPYISSFTPCLIQSEFCFKLAEQLFFLLLNIKSDSIFF